MDIRFGLLRKMYANAPKNCPKNTTKVQDILSFPVDGSFFRQSKSVQNQRVHIATAAISIVNHLIKFPQSNATVFSIANSQFPFQIQNRNQ